MAIEEIRNDIKKVDMELIKLLAKRMELVGLILDEKKSTTCLSTIACRTTRC